MFCRCRVKSSTNRHGNIRILRANFTNVIGSLSPQSPSKKSSNRALREISGAATRAESIVRKACLTAYNEQATSRRGRTFILVFHYGCPDFLTRIITLILQHAFARESRRVERITWIEEGWLSVDTTDKLDRDARFYWDITGTWRNTRNLVFRIPL